MTDHPLVAIVTGASRGAGKGIALALGSHGCTVYVTGRSRHEGDASVPGTIYATADAVTEAGGKGIAVPCDSAIDTDVESLIDQVVAEQGRIDILVNNAYYAHDEINAPGNFWEKPVELGNMATVGIRSGFVTSWHAARHMVRQDKGLIVFTSSPGSMHYCLSPAYGAHKAGMDKMAFDMGVDFSDAGANVAAVSVWMGSLTTERLLAMIEEMPDRFAHLKDTLEPAGYTGHVAWAMFHDPAFMRFNGQTVIGAEVGKAYGIVDDDGRFPPSVRDTTGATPPVYAPYKVKVG